MGDSNQIYAAAGLKNRKGAAQEKPDGGGQLPLAGQQNGRNWLSEFNADFLARKEKAGSDPLMPLGRMSYELVGHIWDAVRSNNYHEARRMSGVLKTEPSLSSIFEGEKGREAKDEVLGIVHHLSEDAEFINGAKKELLDNILQILYAGGQKDELAGFVRLFREQPSLAAHAIGMLTSHNEKELLSTLDLDGAHPVVREYARKAARSVR